MELTESTVSSKLREVYLRNRDDPDLTRRRVTQLCADELGADLSDWREFIKSTLAQIQAEEDEKESDDDNEAAADGAQVRPPTTVCYISPTFVTNMLTPCGPRLST